MQAFPLRTREQDHGAIEVYISCTICPYTQVIRNSTDALEKLYKQRNRLLAASQAQIERYGSATSLTVDAVREIQEQISAHERELKERLGE
jgi:hypothetical protein